MSPRARVVAIVAAAAAVAVGATVGGTILQTRGESTGSTARKGFPPLELPASRALSLYKAGKRDQAEALFERSGTLAGQIGAAFSGWPHGTLDEMKKLVASHPGSALAELHLGLAYFWSGRDSDAAASWQRAAKAEKGDTPYAVVALDFLHPGVAPNLPPIVVDPAAVPTAARAKLLAGAALWNRERPVSAKRALDAAAGLAPHDPAVLSAAAVALFSPAHPLAPFPHLGPLTGAYPKAAVVRFHLGVLLLWTKQVKKGEAQLRLAVADEPASVYAQTAEQILRALAANGTK
jgi:tetratricopeptide (TPR) repeat protein